MAWRPGGRAQETGMKLFESLKDLADSGYVFRIMDNGGETADRYTIVLCDGDYYAMSSYPTHPQGVSMADEGMDPQILAEWHEEGKAVDLALGDLPEHIALHVLYRENQAWQNLMDSIEANAPGAVAQSREEAEDNEGSHTSGGKGIYQTPEGLMVRRDNGGPDDLGPYATAREALQATLPTDYSLSGSEYFSEVTVSRLEADPAVATAVLALEMLVEAEWKQQAGRAP
jgi:hypothetical protein